VTGKPFGEASLMSPLLHMLQPAPGARSKEKFVSLPEELEELELPPPQLEVPSALFEVISLSHGLVLDCYISALRHRWLTFLRFCCRIWMSV
jgi:hypothetical protein